MWGEGTANGTYLTYIRVGGRWKYLFRAVDKYGVLIASCCWTGNTRAAHRFLSKAATTIRNWPPSSITTDKCPSYPEAVARLKRGGQFLEDTKHRTSEYLNGIIEADHGALQLIKPTQSFQTMKTASATIKGVEIMRMIRRRHCLTCKQGVQNEVRFVNSQFGLAASHRRSKPTAFASIGSCNRADRGEHREPYSVWVVSCNRERSWSKLARSAQLGQSQDSEGSEERLPLGTRHPGASHEVTLMI